MELENPSIILEILMRRIDGRTEFQICLRICHQSCGSLQQQLRRPRQSLLEPTFLIDKRLLQKRSPIQRKLAHFVIFHGRNLKPRPPLAQATSISNNI